MLAAVAGVMFTGLSLEATRAQIAVTEQGQLTDRFTKDLTGICLARANLAHANLRGADLDSSDHHHAIPSGVTFRDADLTGANLNPRPSGAWT
ncbi:pentapeptide repeat-containing protein [Saccharothrix isguenensis]